MADPTRRRHPVLRAILLATLVLAVGALGTTIYVVRHIQPILRASVIEALSRSFHSPVELATLDVSILRGLEVRGTGLKILYLAGPTEPDPRPNAAPMLSVAHFSFRTSLHALLLRHLRIAHVEIDGVELHIPPHAHPFQPPANPKPSATTPRITFDVGQIVCRNVHLFIETEPRPNQPPKDPFAFDIPSLDLTDVGVAGGPFGGQPRPMLYVADVIVPRPHGLAHAFGHFGPWAGADPRATPIDGTFTFTHVDLATIHGLSGTLAATGQFAGQLGHLTVDASNSIPNFALDISAHPQALLAQVHAIVDGTTGDTTLAPVRATLAHTQIVATGTITRVHPPGGDFGHDIALTVHVPQGRIEDLLLLSGKTNPPALRGNVTLDTRLHIPPGKARVAQKIQLAGSVAIQGVSFASPTVQQKVESYSLRAQGKPEDANFAHAPATSDMTVTYSLANSMMTVSTLHYAVSGASVQLAGAYALDGEAFEFKGHVRTEAKASQMVTGWRSLLLMPFDRLLEKHGAGVELPIAISGTGRDPHFGLALGDADEPAAAMAQDLRHRPRPITSH